MDTHDNAYRFRVQARPDGGTIRETRFEELNDAKRYAEACIDAWNVEFMQPSGAWKVIWQDGEVIPTRVGFACLVEWRGQRDFKRRVLKQA